MEDLDNNTSENITDSPHRTALYVTTCIVTSIGLPLTLLAICALYYQVKDKNVAPIFVINLLISDLIQMCCFVIWLVVPPNFIMVQIWIGVYFVGLLASIIFMVCVSLERYLVITCPLWYRFRRSINFSVVICILVWAFCLIHFILDIFILNVFVKFMLQSIFLLLPFPLLIFFLVGSLKALSSSSSVSSEEKRRIMATLLLVLLNYTLLFLPVIIWLLTAAKSLNDTLDPNLYLIFVRLSPLVDLVLYVFMRKGAVDKLLACLCRCRMSREQETTVSGNTTDMVSSV